MNGNIIVAKELAIQLLTHRLPNIENNLCKVIRVLKPNEKLEIILQVMQKNVRAAAALANRGHLPTYQQFILLQILLDSGYSNAIRYLVLDFFIYRMSPRKLYNYLYSRKYIYNRSISFLVYYFLGRANINKIIREKFEKILIETRNNCCIS